jgi:hypothetical protein
MSQKEAFEYYKGCGYNSINNFLLKDKFILYFNLLLI